MSAFKSGSITCASAVGGMFMRSLASRVLHRFGFRQTLMVNAALSGIAIAACGMFYPGTPTWLIWAVVLLGGFFPALQFTSLNSLTYAEIESRDVGRATSLGSFIQQVSLGLGVTVGGIALQISHDLQGHPQMVWSDFWPAFVVVGMFSFLSIPITAKLSRDAGHEISRGTRG
jgi:MFS family permease